VASLYGYRWQQARAGWLRKHPLCVECARRGMTVEAVIVDHITPHRNDMTLFWDRDNWQALCKTCHDSWKQALEHGHLIAGAAADGMPSDPRHPWNR
jgi:5-methylcytosine-specific restriction endonuclease McrA